MDFIELTKQNELYKNRGYFERYGGDVCISIGLVIATLLITGYSSYQSVMAQVKTNWNQHRCNPIYMPFAGIIMPQPGSTTAETTTSPTGHLQISITDNGCGIQKVYRHIHIS
jgi:hypothetical protein